MIDTPERAKETRAEVLVPDDCVDFDISIGRAPLYICNHFYHAEDVGVQWAIGVKGSF